MARIFSFILIMLFSTPVKAQDFITRGKIEFEIRQRNEDFTGMNNETSIMAGKAPAIPGYDVYYMDLLFSGNEWTYKRSKRKSSVQYESDEEFDAGELYGNKQAGTFVKRKNFVDEVQYVFRDSLPFVKWKIQNETRKIAGWECRKALTVIHDSVYVVAFYCPEIIPQAGPELFSGLPGMIMGMAIPRYRITWFATKVELANIDESVIVQPGTKKDKVYDKHELAEVLLKQYKKTGWWKDVTIEKIVNMLSEYLL